MIVETPSPLLPLLAFSGFGVHEEVRSAHLLHLDDVRGF